MASPGAPVDPCAGYAERLRIGDRFRRSGFDEDLVTVTRVFTAPGEPVIEIAGRQRGEAVRFICRPGTAVDLYPSGGPW